MRLRSKQPKFIEVDDEYVIPVRISREFAHNLMTGWWPVGFGWAHLRHREDDSYDLFIRQAELKEDMNLVRLDMVQGTLFLAVELAQSILADDDADEDTRLAAQKLLLQVQQGVA